MEKNTPISIALRKLPMLLYGKEHPYGIPFTGTGDEDTVRNISRNDLINFHNKYYSLDNATLIVVGNIQTDKLKNILEKIFIIYKQKNPKK